MSTNNTSWPYFFRYEERYKIPSGINLSVEAINFGEWGLINNTLANENSPSHNDSLCSHKKQHHTFLTFP